MQVLQEQKPATPLTYIPVGHAVAGHFGRKMRVHDLIRGSFANKQYLDRVYGHYWVRVKLILTPGISA